MVSTREQPSRVNHKLREIPIRISDVDIPSHIVRLSLKIEAMNKQRAEVLVSMVEFNRDRSFSVTPGMFDF